MVCTRLIVRMTVGLMVALGVIGSLLSVATADEAAAPQAQLELFQAADGNQYFAAVLPPVPSVQSGGRHIVVLVNTSAAQTGAVREKSLAALQKFVGELSPEDRVQIVAVDLKAVPMHPDFVAPGSPEFRAGWEKLQKRAPLGSCDLGAGLQAAIDALNKAPAEGRTLVYFGDGLSRAHLLSSEEIANLATQLYDARIPVNAYLIGAQRDVGLMASYATHTGGSLVIDSPEVDAAAAAQQLASAVHATVVYPAEARWSDNVAEVYPQRLPPLRSDRETVVVGAIKAAGPVELTAKLPSGEHKWVLQGAAHPQNGYLVKLVESARNTGGSAVPVPGKDALLQLAENAEISVYNLTELARQALELNDVASAQKMAEAALAQDPQNQAARKILTQVRQVSQEVAAPAAPAQAAPGAAPAQRAAPQAPAADLNLVGPPAPPAAPAEMPGALAAQVTIDRQILAEAISKDVQAAINQARQMMGTNPETARDQLKLKLDEVSRVPDLDPEVRDQLLDQIRTAIRQADVRVVELNEQRRRAAQLEAQATERRLIAEGLLLKEQKITQLMDRFNSLMKEGRYELAEVEAAGEAEKLTPDLPTPLLARHMASQVGNFEKAMLLREARQKGVLDTLYQTERAHVPTPDEPPVVYPDAQTWQELTARRKERYQSMDLGASSPAERKILSELKKPTELDFVDTPLSEVINYLRDRHQIEIQLDKKALTSVGVDTNTPVTKSLRGISLRSALRLLLRDLDLTYVIKDEVLLITTPEQARNDLVLKVYPVADLVVPPNSIGGAGLGGWGGAGLGIGGFGGGFGGYGGGYGGGFGGLGGFGGGFGGYGGFGGGFGGLGGGFFNVPNAAGNGGFRAFSVQDDLSKTPDGQPRQNALPPILKVTDDVLNGQISRSQSPADLWDSVFAQGTIPAKDVREAVRRLVAGQKFEHVTALIHSALRHNQPQPWMYEGLALALEAQGGSREEIERALMSAADFASDPMDFLVLGIQLERHGLEQRALAMYRQVANLMPEWPEPYVAALRLAQKLNDREALKWSTVGILSQVFPQKHQDVWLNALRTAKALLDELKVQSPEEAQKYEQALNEAVARDCIIEVSWVGEADLDLLVEEPGGTLCSLRNPRTTSGGVLVGDVSSQAGREASDGYKEYYVCPRGFSGTYRAVVRRVWGNVVGGKVKVTVYLHFLTDKAQSLTKTIPLKGDEAYIQFELADGRRKVPLAEQQLASAVMNQIDLRNRILAQQLGDGGNAPQVDPSSMASFVQSRTDGGAGVNPVWPFIPVRGGAVGYAPQITVIPEGTMLTAAATVSADRRYVRVNPYPVFQAISEVNIFNFVTGESGQGLGGTGGRGFGGLFGGGFGGGFGGFGGGFGGGFF
ncbi:hypothetical protein [Thermogutta sp.]|uniref:hypothetical protein n=1 Tax=Thermogutta sp. TaxID=1962930 RepID=UPI003C7B3A72